MMDNLSSTEGQIVNQSFNSNPSRLDIALDFDNLLEKVYILFEKLKECCQYIDKHRAEYNFGKFCNKPLNDLFWNPVMRIKQHRNQQANNTAREEALQKFFYKVAGYVNCDFLPYWAGVVEYSILNVVNNSVEREGIVCVHRTLRTYHRAYEAIEASYKPKSIHCASNVFPTGIEENKQYYPIEIIQKIEELEEYRLRPIKKMYTDLNILIRNIKFHDNELRRNNTKPVIKTLTMFYNIAYAFGISDLMFFFTDLISPLGIKQIDLVRTNVYLADFIQGNHTNLDQIISKFKELINGVIALLKLQVKEK